MAEPSDWIDTSRFTSGNDDESSSDDDSSSPSQLVIDAASAGIALLDTPTSGSPSYASSDHHVFFTLATSPSQALRSLNASSPTPTNESTAAGTDAMATTTTANNTHGQAVHFLGSMNITVAEGLAEKMDKVCLYTYKWGSITLDIVATTTPDSASIPMRDMYDKVIPDIKRNVLSSRMSKIGVHSHALLEPYVVALRKLGLSASARSHYIKVMDFVRLCQYYHRLPPEGLASFSNVTSESPVEEVLKMAENDAASFGGQQGDAPYVPLGRKDSVELGANSNYSTSPHQTLSFISADASSVDGRDLVLPSGVHVTLLVRDNVAYVSNQELCKLIPNINRNVMESIRNTYGIMVYPASKAEISLLKWIGVLGMKAGRALLYKITDVAKMFGYWHLPVTPLVKELCDGKIPTKKIDISSSPPTPRQDHAKPSLNTSYPSVSPYPPWSQGDPSSSQTTRSTPLSRTSLDTSGSQSATLTPELFQKPVQFLSSLQKEMSSGVGRVGDRMYSSPFQQTSVQIHTPGMASSGSRVELLPSPKRRRMSGGEGAPLDDQDLEYRQLKWGGHNLTLLCPSDGEPYLALPEFFNKILGHRSTLSVQRKEKLGVVTIPATSVQIHTLRVHGSLDAFGGGAKLISFSSALKLAADGNIDVPRSVYEEYEKYCTKPASDSIRGLHGGTQPHGSQYQGAQPYSTPNLTGRTANVVPRLPQKMEACNSPGEMTSQAFWDPKCVPSHPSIIDLGPAYRMSDGVICHVKWGDQLVVIYTSSRRINYVGLFQIYQMVFKQFVSRMNFKMRMRKLDVRSIRAPSAIRLKMIELNALPPHSPVCGLIKVNEMERLARSYGVTPPPVFYEVFMSRQSKAGKRLPHSLEEGGGGGGAATAQPLEGGKDGMVVSISRQLVHVDSPAQMVSSSIGLQSQPPQSHMSHTTAFKPSTLQTLAKKITQRHRKYNAGVSMVRVCPACHKVNPSLKKRCQYCSQFLIGRACASCGTLNHNRAKDCLKCHTAILPLQPGQPNGTPMVTLSALSSSAEIQSSSHYASPYTEGDDMEQLPSMDGEMGSPSSPTFSAPPIRSAVLKNLFSREPPKDESAQVVTKTVYSGNLMTSRQCMECGQLNSKMAKKCVQCRSPLQGRACPRCNRPNHNHSTECYKCGGPLPPTASRWVYSGMKGYRGSGHHGGSASSRLLEGAAETRAPIGCIRCFKLRLDSRLKCGRCGDVFHTKPLYPVDQAEGLNGPNSPIKDEKADHSDSFLLDFGRNLACLGVEDQLVPIITTVEAECRTAVCTVEEQYNDVEEEYQNLLAKKEDKTSEYKDLEAELGGLIRQLELQQVRLDKMIEQEKDANLTLGTYPNRMNALQQKITSSDQLISAPLVGDETYHIC